MSQPKTLHQALVNTCIKHSPKKRFWLIFWCGYLVKWSTTSLLEDYVGPERIMEYWIESSTTVPIALALLTLAILNGTYLWGTANMYWQRRSDG